MKKTNKSIILKFSLFFIVNFSALYSQVVTNNDPINVKSPGVTDFIKYGNIGSSGNDGVINLNIALLSVDVKNQRPIEVNIGYNSSGFIPSKRPGLVGLNWFLDIGGVITREIKGVADDHDGDPATNGEFCDPNGFIVGVRKKTNDFADVFNFVSSTGYKHYKQVWLLGTNDANNVDDAYEGSPDIFSFNFNGISGKFFMGNDGTVKITTNQPNNLIVDLTGFKKQTKNTRNACYPLETSEIKITDNQGNQYIFGGESRNLEYSMFIGTQAVESVRTNVITPTITSWFLREIIYANDSRIKFTYRTASASLGSFCESRDINVNNPFFYLNGFVRESSQVIREKSIDLSHRVMINSVKTTFSNPKLSFELSKKAILDKIEGDDFVIDLNYSIQSYFFNIAPGWFADYENKDLKLDNLVLSDKNSKIIKRVDFEYEYQGGVNSRMFLKKIIELGKAPYSFEYNPSSALPVPTTRGTDYWGFWNGNDSQTSIIPDVNYTESGDFTYLTAEREPNFNFAKQAMLSKVIYPTGGYSVFEYEPHSYGYRMESLSANTFLPMLNLISGTVGGTRIRKIYDFDGISSSNVKEYEYVKLYSPTNPTNINSSGILLQWPRYATVLESSNDFGAYQRQADFSSSSVNMPIFENSVINYSEVTEKTVNAGYIVRKFTDFFTNPDMNDINFRYNDYLAPRIPVGLCKIIQGDYLNDRSIERNKIKSEEVYNSSAKMVSSILYKYNESASRFNSFSTSINDDIHFAKANKLYFYNDYLSQRNERTYDNLNFIEITENYSYSTISNNLSSQSILNSKGEKLTTKYFYTIDTEMAGEPNISLFKAKNMTGVLLDVQSFKGDLPDEKLFEKKTVYAKDATTSNLLLPKFIYAKAGIDSNTALEKKMTYDKYDTSGNILQYTTENSVPVSVIWGYNKSLPIAKIENAIYENISATLIDDAIKKSNTGNETDLLIAQSALRAALPKAMVTTYTYIPLLGISTITDNKGSTIYYNYDDNKRLSIIRDQNLNVLQRYCYNYKSQLTNCTNTIYFSALKQAVFDGYCNSVIVGPVTYKVEAGRYMSTISQLDADNKAQADINNNGQNYANKNVLCTYGNDLITGNFLRENCGVGSQAIYIAYTVPAGKYTSTVSKQEAQVLAQADFDANGQNYANTNGICSPISFTVIPNKEYLLNKIFLELYASSNNHAGHTYNIEINYFRDNGDFVKTETSVLSLLAGETYKKFTIAAPISTNAEIQY